MPGDGGQWLWIDNDQEEGKEDIKKRTLFWKWIVVMTAQHCECTSGNSFCHVLFFKCGIKAKLILFFKLSYYQLIQLNDYSALKYL